MYIHERHEFSVETLMTSEWLRRKTAGNSSKLM
jgi:hypothetical protein